MLIVVGNAVWLSLVVSMEKRRNARYWVNMQVHVANASNNTKQVNYSRFGKKKKIISS